VAERVIEHNEPMCFLNRGARRARSLCRSIEQIQPRAQTDPEPSSVPLSLSFLFQDDKANESSIEGPIQMAGMRAWRILSSCRNPLDLDR
jgi:hypothetical protein